MSPSIIEAKLSVNSFALDNEVHISIKKEICDKCEHHACLYACPADCYKPSEGSVIYSHEGCLECGSCRVACDKGSVSWDLPRGGFGVCFEYS